MTDEAPASPSAFLHFGLIVTGEAEERHLPSLFRSIMATQTCHFKVIRRTGQINPVTSEKRRIEMVGAGKRLPTRDEERIGMPAHRHLRNGDEYFLVVIDDMEHIRLREDLADKAYARYRTALDEVIPECDRARASVHFLVTMLEACFLPQPEAINEVLGVHMPPWPTDDDPEDCRNPKAAIKQACRKSPNAESYKETEHAEGILKNLDILKTLEERPNHFAFLRTLFAWCFSKVDVSRCAEPWCKGGVLADLTKGQLDDGFWKVYHA